MVDAIAFQVSYKLRFVAVWRQELSRIEPMPPSSSVEHIPLTLKQLLPKLWMRGVVG